VPLFVPLPPPVIEPAKLVSTPLPTVSAPPLPRATVPPLPDSEPRVWLWLARLKVPPLFTASALVEPSEPVPSLIAPPLMTVLMLLLAALIVSVPVPA
jgi:hypothetical protein